MPAESVRRNRTKWPWLALLGLTNAVVALSLVAGESTTPSDVRFKFKRYDALSSALYRSSGFATSNDDNVNSVFIDSSGRLWVGTVAGLAAYDGKKWTNRTFPMKGLSPVESTALRLLQISHCGPDKIVEGPPGTIWFGGRCGVWRLQDGQYEEVKPGLESGILGMAVDHQGALWIVNKERVQRYDRSRWNTVLCPYIGKPKSVEAAGLYGIVIDTNRNVWIGGTVYGEPTGPWEHEGPIWVVDQERKQRGDGPPMAPVFKYDGNRWRAFGPSDGVDAKRGIPESDAQGRIFVKTSQGYRIREDGAWRPANDADLDAGKRWILRDRRRGLLTGYSELLFRDGNHLVQVRPASAETGELLEIGSEQLAQLHIAEDSGRDCVWLGTSHGLYRIWLEKKGR